MREVHIHLPVQWEVLRLIVAYGIGCGVRGRDEMLRQSSHQLLQIANALRTTNWIAGRAVVVERLVEGALESFPLGRM